MHWREHTPVAAASWNARRLDCVHMQKVSEESARAVGVACVRGAERSVVGSAQRGGPPLVARARQKHGVGTIGAHVR